MRWACVAILAAAAAAPLTAASGVEVKVNEAAKRVDVTIDGKPFTSYIWPTTLKKPVLYPLRTAKGTLVTRGFPLDPRPGERVDHPHHVGMWLNHGDVNGLDFWNNSDAIPAADAPKMGTIYHQKVVDTKSGADQGELTVETAWMTPDNKQLLKETTRFIFRGGADSRTIDRITTLTALDQKVVFKDSKEAFLGMRVTRALEQPADKAEVFTDASGKATPVPVLDNTGVTGKYISSEGKEGDAVWGTRGKWTMLGGTVEGEPVTSRSSIIRRTSATRPTGMRAATGCSPPIRSATSSSTSRTSFDYTLEPGKSVTFKYRVLILERPVDARSHRARVQGLRAGGIVRRRR